MALIFGPYKMYWHENLGTTQIYTHISDANRKQAIDANPLAHVKKRTD